MKKEIKISFKNEIKRFEIPPSFKELKETIQKCFKQVKDTDFQITYLDDEQDNVVISNEFDLEQVFMFMDKQKMNLLRASLDMSSQKDFDSKVDEVDRNTFNNSINLNEEVKPAEQEVKIEAKPEEKHEIVIVEPETKVEEKRVIIEEKKEEIIVIPEDIQEKVEIPEKKEEIIIVPVVEEAKIVLNDVPKEKKECKEEKKKIDKVKKEKKDKKDEVKDKKKEKKQADALKDLIKTQNNELKAFLSEIIENKFSKLKTKLISETIKKNSALLEKTMESFQHIPIKVNKVKENIVHPEVHCKGCSSTPIEGIRYKCSVCFDFDYCEACEEKLALSHNHPFLKIRVPFPLIEKFPQIEKPIEKIEIIEQVKAYPNAKCVSENFAEFEQGQNELTLIVSLENNGNVDWTEDFTLRNIHGIFGDKARINRVVKPGDKIEIPTTFTTKNLKLGEYTSRWQLHDGKDNCFGQFIDIKFKVTLKKKEDVIVKEEPKVEQKPYRFYNKLHEMKNAYYLGDVQNEKILDALEKANGNLEEAIIYLL